MDLPLISILTRTILPTCLWDNFAGSPDFHNGETWDCKNLILEYCFLYALIAVAIVAEHKRQNSHLDPKGPIVNSKVF
jgi:hypothetical protein